MGEREYIIKIVEVIGRRRWYGVRRPSKWGYYIHRGEQPVARGPAIWSTRCEALSRATQSVIDLDRGVYSGHAS